jgi:hypothetical protein
MLELKEASTDTPSPKGAAIVVRSRRRFNKEEPPEIDVAKSTQLESIFETLAH